MASIKELRLRIKSLKNTNKITAAMKLVATSKLKKSQDAMKANQPFSEKLTEILKRVIGSMDEEKASHPLITKRPIKKIRYYIFSSDKGLCGNFNNGIFKYFRNKNLTADFEVITVGRKVHTLMHKHAQYNVIGEYNTLTKTLDNDLLTQIVNEATKDYTEGKIDQVILVYNKFESVLSQTPTEQVLLPVEAPKGENSETDYIFEPSAEKLLAELLPQYIQSNFYQGLLENAAGEHGARMTAMDNATKNSKELIDNLTIVMNRARQAAITTELTEIVSGAESLKG